MTAEPPPRTAESAGARPPLWVWLPPALLAALLFAPTLGHGFTYDDVEFATTRLEAARATPLTRFLFSYRGLTEASFALEARLWGQGPTGYHATNLALYALASGLVAAAAFRLLRSARAALVCGLLFAAHPVHTEVVASFVNRKDLLAMVFSAAALLAWDEGERVTRRCGLAYLFFALGLASKEIAVAALPLLLGLLDLRALSARLPRGQALRATALRVAPFFAIALACVPLLRPPEDARIHSGGAALNALQGIAHESNGTIATWPQAAAAALAAVPEQVRLLAFPWALSPDYPHVRTGGAGEVAFGLLVLVAWAALAFAARRRYPQVAFGLAWALVMWLPISNLVPVIFHFVAERYLFVPSFGACLAAAALFARGLERGRTPNARAALWALFALVLAAGAWRSYTAGRAWRDNASLARAAFDAGFETKRIHELLARHELSQGEISKARHHLERALALHPVCSLPEIPGLLAEAYFAEGRYQDAARQYRHLVHLWDTPDNRLGLAKCLIMAGELEEGRRICDEVLAADPDNPSARYLLQYAAGVR